ncbi:hypothetical protein LJ754_09310 [Arthrobacter sp. zg-Y40]|uniref:hypothetical protein n=1 Tax=Arthrobacter sp. zg-Y40 TaxID=2886939 RepID=UPI001D14F28A|nr:hypothetical protein [Arthrobacter sp. zg-Y40]MCC3279351.1 hypothetical protein [Arthrobacter sp. zg-Y40]
MPEQDPPQGYQPPQQPYPPQGYWPPPAQGNLPPQPYPPQGYYPPPWHQPENPRGSAGKKKILSGGSVLIILLACYSALVAFPIFIGLGMTQQSSYPPGVREKYELILVLLCPGPLVALGLAWAGYGVLRRKHPVAALSWFCALLLAWLLVFLIWLGPEMVFPMTGSFFSGGDT